MHAIKCSWVGQTFALATSNECGGKRPRIRRSKEERKEMVVSFIKRYQSGNNGNFPSLNLTHKEVGGSFYTVREIVREVIQENRVLGPAKLLHDEENSGHWSNHSSSGAMDPERSSVKDLNGSPFVSDQNQSSIGEYYLMSNGVIAETGDRPISKEEIIMENIAPAIENGQFDVPEITNIQTIELVETEKCSAQVVASGDLNNQIKELEADASLEQPVTDESDLLNGNYSEEMSSNLEEMSNGVIAETGHWPINNEEITMENIAPAVENGQFDVPETSNIQTIELVETEKCSVQVVASGDVINQIKELEVAASLEQPVINESDLLNGNYSEEMSSNLVENVPVELGKEGSFGLSSSEKMKVGEKELESSISHLMDENSSMEAEKTVKMMLNEPVLQKDVEDVAVSKSKVVEMANVIVETFPLRPILNTTEYINENSGEVDEMSGDEKGSKEPCFEVGNGSLSFKGTPKSGSSFSRNAKIVGYPAQSLSETNTQMVNINVDDLTDSSFRSSISLTNQTTVDSNSQLQTSIDTFCNGKAGEVQGVVDSPGSVLVKPMNDTLPGVGGLQSTGKMVRPKNDIQHRDSSFKEGRKATLDRIKIETWESASGKQKVHPLVAIIKSFIDSFVKFWSE